MGAIMVQLKFNKKCELMLMRRATASV